jgi:hypothetical protein
MRRLGQIICLDKLFQSPVKKDKEKENRIAKTDMHVVKLQSP